MSFAVLEFPRRAAKSASFENIDLGILPILMASMASGQPFVCTHIPAVNIFSWPSHPYVPLLVTNTHLTPVF